MDARRKTRGFTLIEVFLGLLIVGLLLMLGMPSFITFLRNSEIRSTAESLINGLRAATAEAANRNQRVTFQIANDGSADWSFWVLNEEGDQEVLQSFTQKETGKNSVITRTPGDQTTVSFTGLGRVENPGTDTHIRQLDIASSAGDARALRIIIDDAPTDPAKPRGLRMCDPDTGLKALNDPRAC